jgi:hypothetical protein
MVKWLIRAIEQNQGKQVSQRSAKENLRSRINNKCRWSCRLFLVSLRPTIKVNRFAWLTIKWSTCSLLSSNRTIHNRCLKSRTNKWSNCKASTIYHNKSSSNSNRRSSSHSSRHSPNTYSSRCKCLTRERFPEGSTFKVSLCKIRTIMS